MSRTFGRYSAAAEETLPAMTPIAVNSNNERVSFMMFVILKFNGID